MSKIVEKNGLVTETFYGTEKGVVQERKIDHKPILEHNKKPKNCRVVAVLKKNTNLSALISKLPSISSYFWE